MGTSTRRNFLAALAAPFAMKQPVAVRLPSGISLPSCGLTWHEKREALSLILAERPDLSAALGLTDPANHHILRAYLLPGA